MAKLAAGIVGLPNVGKSSLFNALTRAQAASENYPFCTIDPNVGVVDVPDARLEQLSELSGSKRILPATMQFVDIAGLVKGASQGEGLGNQFLQHIRETDAIVHVVRCFEDPNVIHVHGQIDPLADIDTIDMELMLADIQMIDHAMGKLEKQARASKDAQEQVTLLQRIREQLDVGVPVRRQAITSAQLATVSQLPFLTAKPVLYACNVAEVDLPHMTNQWTETVYARAQQEGSLVVPFCATLEEELAQLSPAEALSMCRELGLDQPGLDRLIQASYKLLGLISFLTTGEMETRAWTITQGSTAYDAAGKIHTDIQKGFARAEVISYEDFVKLGGRSGAREAGRLRSEGRDYLVQDGDVILFLHH